MALKIVLLVAFVCVAQGFSMKPLVKQPPAKPCKDHPIPASAEEIPHDFEEAMHDMDDVRETVATAAMEAHFKGADPQVVAMCFRQQKSNYIRLGQRISGDIRKASQEIGKDLGDKYEKYGKPAEEPLKNIAVTMKKLPQKMWFYIKQHEFGQALEVMRESRRVVEENSKVLGGLMNGLRGELPETAKKAEDMAREIRKEAREGCKAIGDAFKQCVREGGPKNPISENSSESISESNES